MPRERCFRILIVCIGLAGLILQYQLSHGMLTARGLGLGGVLLKLASYFTILTNALLVAVHGICLAAPGSRIGRKLAGPAVQGALLLYILVVGLVYMTLLAGLWNPQGKQWWADNLLHRVTTLLQLGFWIAFVPKVKLPWRLAFVWLVWPAVYLLWALARGGDYPYPFLELDRLGPMRTALNCLMMGAGFLAGGLAIIAASRRLER